MMTTQQDWLEGAVIYQIYPRSFYDTSGTGVGSIQGITDKLDYLGGKPDSLGVTAIWISPVYRSPMADFGYDISDYCDIDPIFGTIDDVKTLLNEAHARSIKVLMDFVPNHSSDEHPWFNESQSSLDNPKRDWYIWRDAKPDGSPPNNWLSVFGGSAWTLSPQTNQYYLHSFLAKQPDLNWDNPKVRQAMKSAMRFWLDIGVDGFRVDAVDWLSKDAELRDDPINEHAASHVAAVDHDSLRHRYSRDGPNLFARLNEMTEVLAEYEGRFMITEAHPETGNAVAGYVGYYEGVNPLFSAPFNFEGIYLPWNPQSFRNFIDDFQQAMRPTYMPIYTIGNHDESRIASRIGPAAARTAALMQMTLPGMAFVYYGEEIGMANVLITKEQVRDPFAGLHHGRDPQRTPMQWDSSLNAGFSRAKPWLPVATDISSINVQAEQSNNASSLTLYKRLIALRRQSPAIRKGTYQSIDSNDYIFSYRRQLDGEEFVIVLNFSDKPHQATIADLDGIVCLSTHLDNDGVTVHDLVALRPNEGMVIQVIHD